MRGTVDTEVVEMEAEAGGVLEMVALEARLALRWEFGRRRTHSGFHPESCTAHLISAACSA